MLNFIRKKKEQSIKKIFNIVLEQYEQKFKDELNSIITNKLLEITETIDYIVKTKTVNHIDRLEMSVNNQLTWKVDNKIKDILEKRVIDIEFVKMLVNEINKLQIQKG